MPKPDLPAPRTTALLALEALDRYVRGGLVLPGEGMHETLAVRLVKTARSDKWEKLSRSTTAR